MGDEELKELSPEGVSLFGDSSGKFNTAKHQDIQISTLAYAITWIFDISKLLFNFTLQDHPLGLATSLLATSAILGSTPGKTKTKH